MQKVYKEALEFLEKDFGDKKAAIFLWSLESGNPKSYDDAVTKYIKRVLTKYHHVKPVAAEAFVGRMKILGFISDNNDMEKVTTWADELGYKLRTS